MLKGIKELSSIQISIASPETVRQWSKGVVKKPETINYRTHRPERDGLFCERIFGPTKDWECFCGKYKSIRYKGLVCERCGVEVTRSNVRRERMGHIELVAPVAHIWYSKGTPNYIALLLDITARDFEKVLYFNSYIVIDPGSLPLLKKQILSEDEHAQYQERYGDMYRAGTGGVAVAELLRELDLSKLVEDLKRKLREDLGSKKQNIVNRLQVAEVFMNSKNRPEWMIIDVLPVIPPDLRPMVQLDGGRFATSDLNDLYRRVINRNNRLKRLMKLNAPDIIIKNEKRMLQEAVNALIDNGRRGRLVTGSGNRPLKSLNDMLKGKQGRFRQNLLGKRVDYSGRSVIVVGPDLRLHQCGLPQKMALELFKPFIMNKLVEYAFAHNIKSAKKLIEKEDENVWKVLEEIVRDHPIMLNRAPTLHRLGIQAFEPILVQGKAIQLHPLVCGAFNADFDGDQMAVHIPLLLEAQVEARILMMSSYNILAASSGRAVAAPSQDMSIGAFYLTNQVKWEKTKTMPVGSKKSLKVPSLEEMIKFGSGVAVAYDDICDAAGTKIVSASGIIQLDEFKVIKKAKIPEVTILDLQKYSSAKEALLSFENGNHEMHDSVLVKNPLEAERGTDEFNKYYVTTIGRVLFNDIIPNEIGYHNYRFDKKKLMNIIELCYETCGTNETVLLLDAIKDVGFRYATFSGLTIALSDLEKPPRKDHIMAVAEERARKIADRFSNKEINLEERKKAEVDLWINATEEVTDDMMAHYKQKWENGEFNPIYTMAISGARGNVQQMKQLAGMRGLMSNPHGDIMHVPIKRSFKEGLTMTDYFISTYGARKGLVDTALRTADSGYLTRRLVDVAQDVIVTTEDCGTEHGLRMSPLRGKRTTNNILVDEIVIPIEDRIFARTLLKDVVHPETNKTILKGGITITKEIAKQISLTTTSLRVDKIKPGMLTDECVVNLVDNSIICGPDQLITPQLIEQFKAHDIDDVRVYPQVWVRSPITCKVEWGVCRKCYAIDLSTGQNVSIGTAVGVIAAQSIGEPGTQLTMRTFHTGGIAEAARIVVKAKVTGHISLDDLTYEYKVERARFQIDTGNDASENDEFDDNVKKIVTGGVLKITDKKGKKYEFVMPQGGVLRVEEGEFVTAGQVLVEYNPSTYITSYSGVVKFASIVRKDGVVVHDGEIEVYDSADSTKLLGSYKIPKGSALAVEDGETVAAGDNLYLLEKERSIVIASSHGTAEFRDIKIKNQRVISENGMIFIASDDLEDNIYESPKGLKSSATKPIGLPGDLGVVLKVKSGDQVKANDELCSIFAEFSGEVKYTGRKTLSVIHKKSSEYYMTGSMDVELDEDNKQVRFLAEGNGIVKLISYRSASNKTVDRRRVLIKDEREYVIPESCQLRFDNVVVQSGDDVEVGQKLTGTIPFITEVEGTVAIKDHYAKSSVLLEEDLQPESLVGAVFMEDASHEGAVLYKAGEEVTSEIAQDLYEKRESVGKVEVSALSESKRIIITNDETSREYITPGNAELLVAEGDEVEVGAKLINSFAPIVADIEGKVNFITEYNKRTGEEMVRSILVYSGKDYFLSTGLPLCVKNGQKVEKGDAITEFLEYTNFEALEDGVCFTREEVNEKKYTVTDDIEVLVTEGEVKKGDQIARMVTESDGTVKLIHALTKTGKVRSVIESVQVQAGEVHSIPDGAEIFVKENAEIKPGDILAKWSGAGKKTTDIVQGLPRINSLFEVRNPKVYSLISSRSGVLRIRGNNIVIENEKNSEKQVVTGALGDLIVTDGEYVSIGDKLTDGDVDVKSLSESLGIFDAQKYLLNEVQTVYTSQGVTINDKHVETILRRMVSKVRITGSGDSPYNTGNIINAFEFKKTNDALIKDKFKPATAVSIIQGISKASLTTDSFLSAASFQETTKVLTNAAIQSKIDNLSGLKENIIMGNLIPAGTGFDRYLKYDFDDKESLINGSEDREELEGNFEISLEDNLGTEFLKELNVSTESDD
ncbi:MAG: DNA-directed RNA polymerase subunit beta' [Candidatus Cloacimonetes bacterium]|nr:DNA-directed RNA polymerase subunit beta' [Candidatus Cloacimonadota bacterium]